MSILQVTQKFKSCFHKQSAQATFEESSFCDVSKFPLFSVLVVSYQQMHLLGDCLYSILKQDYPNIEIIVCDDDSADFDSEGVKTFIEKYRTKNIRNVVIYKQSHNVGIIQNVKTAVELSSGFFFKAHGGDDMLYHSHVLTEIARKFNDSGINIIAARSTACNSDCDFLGYNFPYDVAFAKMQNATAQQQLVLTATALWSMYVSPPAVFWKRSFFDLIGGLDTRYTYIDDIPMWLKITSMGYRITMYNSITTIYRMGGNSNSFGSTNFGMTEQINMETMQVLQEIHLTKEKAGSWVKLLRHKHCIHGERVRTVIEKQWMFWTWPQRILWRIKNLDYLFVSWLYRCRSGKVNIPVKNSISVIVSCAIMYLFHVQIWPTVSGDMLWAGIGFLASIFLLMQLGLRFFIQAMQILLSFRGEGEEK